MTSIIILVHNAYDYVKNTIETLQMTKNKKKEPTMGLFFYGNTISSNRLMNSSVSSDDL